MAPSYGTAGDDNSVIFGGAVATARAGMRLAQLYAAAHGFTAMPVRKSSTIVFG
jgi:hypothetical protein